jgi:hypothetical protein
MENLLPFNAALMQKKALKAVESNEQVQDICRQIQEEAEKGGFTLRVTVKYDDLSDGVSPASVWAFLQLLGVRVKLDETDGKKAVLELWWDSDPDAMREVANQLYMMR